MLIVCPSCASEYMIDPTKLGAAGRNVRCATCKETWFVTAEPEAAAEAAAEEEGLAAAFGADAPKADREERLPAFAAMAAEREDPSDPVAAMAKEPAPATPGRFSRFAHRARGLASPPLLVIVALLMVGGLILGRGQVVRTLPRMAGLYAVVGLPVNLRGIEFRGVRSELVTNGADAFLVVEGEIANLSGREASVPVIEIGVQGADGQPLYTWTADPPLASLGRGETARFRARLASPPAEARQVLVHFGAGEQGAALASHIR